MAERGVQNSLVKRALAAVRRFLRSIGITLEFSDADLAGMLRTAERYLETGNEFARSDDMQPEYSAQAPMWYSALARGLTAAKQAKATAADWKAIIAKLPGVKADEIDAVGLEEWLDTQSGQVSREQVLDFVRANGVQVQEVEKGEVSTPQMEEYEREMGLLQEKINVDRKRAFDGSLGMVPPQVISQVGQWAFDMALDNQQAGQSRGRLRALGLSDEHVEAIKEYGKLAAESKYLNEKILAARKGTDTKFVKWQLPGGENYRELLLTLPVQTKQFDTQGALEEIKRRRMGWRDFQ